MYWVSLIVFILCFSSNGAFEETGIPHRPAFNFEDRATLSIYGDHIHDFVKTADLGAFQWGIYSGETSHQGCQECREESENTFKGLKCFSDLLKIKKEVKKGSLWALKYSTGKIPDGYLRGNRALGNYDECLGIHNEKFNISSQYCLVAAISSKLETPLGLNGLCAPISCKPLALQNILNSKLGKNSSIVLYVDEKTCQHAERTIWTSEDTAFASAIAIYVVILLILTILWELNVFKTLGPDVKENSSDHVSDLRPQDRKVPEGKIAAFCKNVSLVNNYQKLVNSKRSENDIGCLHGLRFFSMCWVVMGHNLSLTFQGLNANWIDAFEDLRRLTMQVFMNATVSVDTFFVLSGTLAAYGLMHAYRAASHKTALLKAGCIFLTRYIRLTPLLLVSTGYLATVNILTGNGPFWFSVNNVLQENCRRNMWINLLYVQNYIETQTMCLGPSWYLACDMHFFLVSLAIIPILKRYPWTGIGVILSGVIISDGYVTIVTYLKNYPPTVVLNTEATINIMDYFRDIYITSHARFGPYGVGLILGYYLYKNRGNRKSISKVTVALGWIIFSGMAMAVLFGMFHYNNKITGAVNKTAVAFYAGLHRTVWSLSISWIIFSCYNGYGGWINKFLSLEIFVPLGRITYSTYLISMIIQNNIVSSTRGFVYYDGFLNPYLIYVGMLFYILVIASCLTLVFESPWIQIAKMITLAKRS